MSRIFLSWSGDKSQKVANFLYNWLPSVLQFADPYFSPEDIEKGKRWSSDVSNALGETDFGIICLSKDNISKPWILFEAGALSKNIINSNVCTLLIDLNPVDVSGPLSQFQHTSISKDDIRKMMKAINDSNSDRSLNADTFSSAFEKWWPEFIEYVESINKKESEHKGEDFRSDREIIEDILLTVRRLEETKEVHLSQRNAWSAENMQRLESMWKEGYNASDISREIGVSRNAIIGKVHRLGLARELDMDDRSLKRGDQVYHKKFGDGIVVDLSGNGLDQVSVEFNSGMKKVVSSYLKLK